MLGLGHTLIAGAAGDLKPVNGLVSHPGDHFLPLVAHVTGFRFRSDPRGPGEAGKCEKPCDENPSPELHRYPPGLDQYCSFPDGRVGMGLLMAKRSSHPGVATIGAALIPRSGGSELMSVGPPTARVRIRPFVTLARHVFFGGCQL